MTPSSAQIVCAKAPRYVVFVPATRNLDGEFYCGFCGVRVKVVA
jgi:hypothetical protein